MIVSAVSPQPQGGASETTSAKRPLTDLETAPAPKAKRMKEKFKLTTPGTQEASTTSTGKHFLFEYQFSIGPSRCRRSA